jgi:NAD(P)H dehydrogenase (quinone)
MPCHEAVGPRLSSAGFVAVRRLEAIAAVLTEDSHEGKTYDLTGHDAVSWAQLAELASARAGKPVPYRSIDDTEAATRMEAAGIPAPYIPSMLGFYAAYRAGWSGTPSGHIEQLAGRPATPTLDAIAAVLAGTAR